MISGDMKSNVESLGFCGASRIGGSGNERLPAE